VQRAAAPRSGGGGGGVSLLAAMGFAATYLAYLDPLAHRFEPKLFPSDYCSTTNPLPLIPLLERVFKIEIERIFKSDWELHPNYNMATFLHGAAFSSFAPRRRKINLFYRRLDLDPAHNGRNRNRNKY